MYFSSFADFLAMGGHGLYVWLSYGIALAIMIFNVIVPVVNAKTQRRVLKQRIVREQQRES
ncbi:heme exporter protein CcmD [Pokkaliibacter sp. CJK22405]|uniref:heme exporter protein CcmD n=1 Tax=Pokkaliibacter sp. CJK22405 TaxID=3384615 RepID=UPI00398554D0